jgi:hypothetical protein
MRQPPSNIDSKYYRCIYCGKKLKFSLPHVIAHFDENHPEISENDRQELIKSFRFDQAKLRKSQDKKLLKQKTKNNHCLQEKHLQQFKDHVLKTLEGNSINPEIINKIKAAPSLKKVKRILKSDLAKMHQICLNNAGIDYNLPKRKRRKKNITNSKMKETKFLDKTKKSIYPIYTPMGNKR